MGLARVLESSRALEGRAYDSEHVEFHFCKMKHSGGSTGDSHKNNV